MLKELKFAINLKSAAPIVAQGVTFDGVFGDTC